MIKDKPLKVPKLLLPALRQFQHNDCSGTVTGFDYNKTIEIVSLYEKAFKEMINLLAES